MTTPSQRAIAVVLEAGAGHAFPGHPESPGRFAHFDSIVFDELGDRLVRVDPSPAPIDAVLRVHSEDHLARIQAAQEKAPAYLDYGDTYVTTESLKMALRSAGGVLAVLRAVLQGRAPQGFAFTRPPGHHATADRAMGFCLLNNVAIAARAAQADGIGRVAIVDFDVHHGNGTEAIFYSDPDVLYVSTHQVGIYPGTGAIDDLGTGKGLGSTVNLPLPALAGDRAFESAIERVIAPALARHRPDLILVSAGFDAHWRDPLANLRVTPAGFHDISQHLTQIASNLGATGPVFCLEGGYEPEALAHSVNNALRGILDLPCSTEPRTPPDAEEPDIEGLLDLVADVHGL